MIIETLPIFYGKRTLLWLVKHNLSSALISGIVTSRFYVETFFMIAFSLEICFRFAPFCNSLTNLRYFFTRWLNIIDILAIFPYYLDLLLYPETALGTYLD